jgi:two-component system chemotaxis response regulator CheY
LAAAPILVVDDDAAVREVVAAVLDAEGYEVLTAANGAEALAVIERQRPGLLVLDMRMPVLDGWGVAQQLAARGIRLPILVMTAARDARRWAAEIGATGYVDKPFNIADLLTAVERAVQ